MSLTMLEEYPVSVCVGGDLRGADVVKMDGIMTYS
jgi:hypothetical protein